MLEARAKVVYRILTCLCLENLAIRVIIPLIHHVTELHCKMAGVKSSKEVYYHLEGKRVT
jgi:hypothetical protein